MYKMNLKTFCLLYVSLLSCQVVAKDLITWGVHDMPPAWIISGDSKDQEIIDFQRKVYKENPQEFDHSEILMTQKRLHIVMENTKREKYLLQCWPANS